MATENHVLYAHSANASGVWHTFGEHATGVARLARDFARVIGAEKAAEVLGWWHDAGKLHPKWQEYLRQSTQGTWPKNKKGPEHALIGFLALYNAAQPYLALLCNCHHKGLVDKSKFQSDLARAQKDNYIQEAVQQALALLKQHCSLEPSEETLFSNASRKNFFPTSASGVQLAALAWRLLHSCLVDADCLDTEAHFAPQTAQIRQEDTSLESLYQLLRASQEALMQHTTGELNSRRRHMYGDAIEAAVLPPGFFSLTMPTGAGKTRTGMAFALAHALEHGLRRVITAIPYTSIIEQNADVYRAIFEASPRAVLEHHSARMNSGEARDEELERWERLSAQNWDAPIIVTTNVQLLESLFAARNSRLRRLHNIPKSVIVLDEVQTLPAGLLAPTLDVLRYLVEHFGCSVVFSTATQPAFTNEVLGGKGITPLEDIREIIKQPEEHFLALKRVTYHMPHANRRHTFSSLAEELRGQERVLVILNTVKDAQRLLNELEGEEGLFHLSTRLCGAHRRKVLRRVRRILDDPGDSPCRLISTQVVEAGVDIDFPVVYRVMGPLDSIIQAAGRCNREARAERGEVFIVELEEASIPPGSYTAATDQTRILLKQTDPEQIEQPETCREYFRRLYGTQELDKHKIIKSEFSLNFATSAQHYRLIEDPGTPVLVRYQEHETAIQDILDEAFRIGHLLSRHLKLLQPYLVNLRRWNFEQAQQEGLVQSIMGGVLFEWVGGYDTLRGLVEELLPSQLIFA